VNIFYRVMFRVTVTKWTSASEIILAANHDLRMNAEER